MRLGSDLILIAQSACMLAHSASRAGFNVSSLDFFSDQDTQTICTLSKIIPSDWNESQIIKQIREIAKKNSNPGLVYGSGLDNKPKLLAKIGLFIRVFGNSPECLKQVNSPKNFFKRLDELNIPYPNICFSHPKDREGWLIKPSFSEGGKGIGFNIFNRDCYYQRLIPGDAYSILFLANGMDIRSVGFNKLMISNHDPMQPFLFAGAVNLTPLNRKQCNLAQEYALKLTCSFGLIGLNSMDFMLEDESIRILEINPRPSSSMSLYDADYPKGLLYEHIKACQGELTEIKESSNIIRAFKIIYSPKKIVFPQVFEWLKGFCDRPNPGAQIDATEPLCSLHAEGNNTEEVFLKLYEMEAELFEKLGCKPR